MAGVVAVVNQSRRRVIAVVTCGNVGCRPAGARKMRRISCWSTKFQQLFPPTASAVLVALWFGLALFVRAMGIGPVATWVWGGAIALAVVASVAWLIAPRVRHVDVDEDRVRVSGVFRTATLPLSSVTSVTEWPKGRFHMAAIEFDHDTPFGRKVQFIPRTQLARVGWLRWRRTAPVVLDLATSAHSRYTCVGDETEARQ